MTNLVRGFVATCAASLLASCATLKPYPICLYDTDLGAATAAAAAWPALEERLKRALQLATADEDAVVVINSRGSVARTTASEDRRIARFWPSMACFGQSGGSDSSGRLSVCRTYVAAQMDADRDDAQLPAEVIVPYCQTVTQVRQN